MILILAIYKNILNMNRKLFGALDNKGTKLKKKEVFI